MTLNSSNSTCSLRRRDMLLLTTWCAVLFGYISISGRPMTMHEARLPQLAREMMLHQQWIFPHSGERPWLERPPLPHWIMIGFARLLVGPLDAEWSARIPPAVMGWLIVLMTAYLAARWFGRSIGIAAGLMLSTGYEFYYYATLAEDDIFLAALVMAAMVLFVQMDGIGPFAPCRGAPLSPSRGTPLSPSPGTPGEGWGGGSGRWHPLGIRTWRDWLMFLLLGLTNLAKGPIVGAAVVIATLGVYLLWQAMAEQTWAARYQRISRYVWLWGWLLAAMVGASWHVAAGHYFAGHGGYVDNLHYDFFGTSEFNENCFYYFYIMLGRMLPWTPATIMGLAVLFRVAAFVKPTTTTRPPPQPSPGVPGEGERGVPGVGEGTVPRKGERRVPREGEEGEEGEKRKKSIAQFLCTWAIVPIVVLSLPHRKHHHYLVPSLAPWGILAAVGVWPIIRKMFAGPPNTRHPFFGLSVLGLPGTIILLSIHKFIPGPTGITAAMIAIWLTCVLLFYFGLHKLRPALLLASMLLGIGFAYCWGQSCWPNDEAADTMFLQATENLTPQHTPLLVNGSVDTLEFFRNQFYLRPNAILIHNLTYLQSTQFADNNVVYVVSRDHDMPALQKLGQVQIVAQSTQSSREGKDKHGGKAWRFTLFKLTFTPGLKRYAPPAVTVKQAMQRDPGPFCGPAL